MFTIKRKNVWQAFVMYCCALFYIVFLTPNRYTDRQYKVNLIPLIGTLKRFYGQGNEHFWNYYIGYWGNIFGNIILFLPFGFLIKYLYSYRRNYKVVLYGLATSACIEGFQLFLQIGVCDIDDVILNVLGTALGVFIWDKTKHYVINEGARDQ